MKTFVIGDIHGCYNALINCLALSSFDYANDRLIALGDVCDRGSGVRECIDELLKIKHLIFILGNHDAWTLEWAVQGHSNDDWIEHGGNATKASYKDGMPKEHIALLAKAPLYFEENKRLFVHAGFDIKKGVKDTPKEMLYWDRDLISTAETLHDVSPEFRIRGYDEIFIGHTPDLVEFKTEPRHLCNIWAMDTGAAYGYKLTIMDVETKEYWQADGFC